MNKSVHVICGLFFLTATFSTPVLSQTVPNGLDLSRYDTAAGADGTPAFIAGTREADGRPGQYYFNVGAYAFTHHDYSFAVNMYTVAASWAYKPAEYNLGIMYALGQGTTIDLPRAMAWLTLAAERKNPKYVKAQALVEAHLKPGDADRAKVILDELEPRYGDKSALRRAKNRWAQVQTSQTGSLTGHPIGPLSVSQPDGSYLDGSVANQGLMASNSPYNTPTVTVGTLDSVKSNANQTPKKSDADQKPKSNQPPL